MTATPRPPQRLEPLTPLTGFERLRTRLRYGGGAAAGAWKRALYDEALAVRLARAQIPVPCSRRGKGKAERDRLNHAWCQVLQAGGSRLIVFDGGTVTPTHAETWLRSLPNTDLGQTWRNRAMWSALRAEDFGMHFLVRMLAAGGDAHCPDGDSMDPLAPLFRHPLEWLLLKSSGAQLLSRIALFVAEGLSVDDTVRQTNGPLLRRSLDELQAISNMGMTVQDPDLAAKWLLAYVRHPSLLPYREGSDYSADASMACCAFLLAQGADPNVRNADGMTPLMEVLATQESWRSSYPEQARDALERWFDFWVAHGADLTAKMPNGMSLVHLVLALFTAEHQHGHCKPSAAILRALMAANPGAIDVPYPHEYTLEAFSVSAEDGKRTVHGPTPRMLLTEHIIFLSQDYDDTKQLFRQLRAVVGAEDLLHQLPAAAVEEPSQRAARRPRL